MKVDLIGKGVISVLMHCLDRTEPKVLSALCLTLARCFQECITIIHIGEGQIALSKQGSGKGVVKFIEFLNSAESTLCRSAAYAIANAAQYRIAV
jgi:hypothetical protein